MASEENKVNALWIGKQLSKLELLTLHSFIAHGHSFKLWIYDELENDLPESIEIGDASVIIPSEKIFSYRNQNSFGHGKGSYAGFSDIFRYKLLHEHGGWWVDMDITCLKNFDFDAPYVFRNHHELNVVGNVMKCPKNSELMKACYEEAIDQVNEHNTDWHKPIDILNHNINRFGLENYVMHDISNPDHWDETRKYFSEKNDLPVDWFFVHWQNEELRSRDISKNDFYCGSAVARLAAHYKLFHMPNGFWQKTINTIQHSEFIRILVP